MSAFSLRANGRLDLEEVLAHQLENELRPLVQSFLVANTKNDDPQFSLKVGVVLGQVLPEQPKAQDRDLMQPASDIKSARVQLKLLFQPKPQSVVDDLHQYIRRYLEEQGFLLEYTRAEGVNGQIWFEVGIAPKWQRLENDLLGMIAKVLMAIICLMLIKGLSKPARRRAMAIRQLFVMPQQPVQVHTTPPVDAAFPFTGEPRRATSSAFAGVKGDPRLRLDPAAGSWYLHSLNDVAIGELERTFATLPFDEARHVLKRIGKPVREDIVTRLQIATSIKRELMSDK